MLYFPGAGVVGAEVVGPGAVGEVAGVVAGVVVGVGVVVGLVGGAGLVAGQAVNPTGRQAAPLRVKVTVFVNKLMVVVEGNTVDVL